jgi:hypothetical protein
LVVITKLDLTCVGQKAIEDYGAGIGLDIVLPEKDFSGGVVEGKILEGS